MRNKQLRNRKNDITQGWGVLQSLISPSKGNEEKRSYYNMWYSKLAIQMRTPPNRACFFGDCSLIIPGAHDYTQGWAGGKLSSTRKIFPAPPPPMNCKFFQDPPISLRYISDPSPSPTFTTSPTTSTNRKKNLLSGEQQLKHCQTGPHNDCFWCYNKFLLSSLHGPAARTLSSELLSASIPFVTVFT